MFDSAGRGVPCLLDLSAGAGCLIAKWIGKTQYVLTQMVFQEPFALYNLPKGFGWRKSIKLWMAMTMTTALYAVFADLNQLVPGEHQTCGLSFAVQPAARAVDKR